MSKKQIVSIILCAIMACSFIPLTACRKSDKNMSSNSSDNVNSKTVSSDENAVSDVSSESSEQSGSTVQSSGNNKVSTGTGSTKITYTPVATDVALPAMPAEGTEVLNNNPERGFRLEISYDVGYNTVDEIQKILDAGLKQAEPEKIKIAQVYLYLCDYHDKSISQKGLNFVQSVFDVYRKNNISILLRFAYQKDLGRGGEETQNVYNHIKQLAPVVQKNKDVIYAYQAGFVGAWGEWHSESPSVDREGIMNAIVNNLISDDMYMMTRLPNYKNYVSSSNARYNRIGFHNDCFFGKRETSSLGGGGIDPGTAQWNQTMQQSPYTPNDAELYWNNDLTNRGLFVDGKLAIEMMSEHHFTSLSVVHSYVDDKSGNRTSMGDWKKTAVTKDWLNANGITYSNSWFTNQKGQTVSRNAFEWIRDYMGYRVEAQHLTVSGKTEPNSTIKVSMPIKNYGTGAAFNMQSGFVILDSNNKVVSSVKAGDPEKWYSTDPKNYSNRTVLTHDVSGQLKLPSQHGQYKLAFYLKNRYDDYAHISNNLKNENGFTILKDFAY